MLDDKVVLVGVALPILCGLLIGRTITGDDKIEIEEDLK